jgi:hypothetical protein
VNGDTWDTWDTWVALQHRPADPAVAGAVLADPRYAAAAGRLQAEIAAMPPPAAVLPALEALAAGGTPAGGGDRRG